MTVQESYEWFTRHFVHWDEVCRKRYSNPSKWDIFWLEKMDLIKVYAAIKYLPEEVKKARVEWDEMNSKRTFFLPPSKIAYCVKKDQEREWSIMTLAAGMPPKDDYRKIILLQEPKAKEGYLANAPSVTVPDEKAEEYRTDRVPWSKYGLMPQGMAVETTSLVRASGKSEYYNPDIKRNGEKYHEKMHACSGLCDGCICFHCKNDRPECCCKIHTTREDEELPEKQCTDSTCPWFEPEPISIEHLTLNVVKVYRGKLEFLECEAMDRREMYVPELEPFKEFLIYGPLMTDKLKRGLGKYHIRQTGGLMLYRERDFAKSLDWFITEPRKHGPLEKYIVTVDGKKQSPVRTNHYEVRGWYTNNFYGRPDTFYCCDMVRAKDSGKTEEELRQLPMVW